MAHMRSRASWSDPAEQPGPENYILHIDGGLPLPRHIMNGIKIVHTRAAADFRACARIMSATDPWLKLGLDYRTCLKNVGAPQREVYVARAGGRVAGVLVLQMTGTFRGYIQTVCAAPEARGRGVGTALVRFAEKRIFRDSPNVFICVSSFNKGARRLYARLGYKKAGVLKDFIMAGHDELLLRKTTGPLRDFHSRKR